MVVMANYVYMYVVLISNNLVYCVHVDNHLVKFALWKNQTSSTYSAKMI